MGRVQSMFPYFGFGYRSYNWNICTFFHTLASGDKAVRQWGRSKRILYPTDIKNNTKLDPTPPTSESKQVALWSYKICKYAARIFLNVTEY